MCPPDNAENTAQNGESVAVDVPSKDSLAVDVVDPPKESSSAVSSSEPSSFPLSPSSDPLIASWLTFSKCLYSRWTDCPPLYVQFVNLSSIVDVPVKNVNEVPNIFQIGFNGLKNMNIVGKINPQWKTETKKFSCLAPSSGVIRPGTMTLVLAPPGHGKSTFLKGLAGRLQGKPTTGGKVLFNGRSVEEVEAVGIRPNRLAAFVHQTDTHYPLLTVRETFKFSADNSVAPSELLEDDELNRMDAQRPAMMEAFLGVEECKDTIIGNDLVRGVSGGQRKRVSVGEILIQNSRLLLLDEASTGLDSAVTFHIFNSLQKLSRISKQSIVTALLQPSPEVFHLFDDIILLRDGEILYHGDKDGVKPFFKNFLGVAIPEESDIAGFIVDYLADPVNAVRGLIRMQKLKQARLSIAVPAKETKESTDGANKENHPNGILVAVTAKEGTSSSVPLGIEKSSEHEIQVSFHTDEGVEMAHIPLKETAPVLIAEVAETADWRPPQDGRRPFPALTTHEMLRRYHASPYYVEAQRRLKDSLLQCESDPQLQLDPSKWSEYSRLSFATSFPRSYFQLFKYDVVRQRVLMWRNKMILIPRIMQSVLTGIIYGTLFFQLSLDEFQAKMGLLMYVVMYGAFSNLAELPAAADARAVITKQIDSGFCSVPPFILSNIFWSLPRIFIEAAAFGSLMYWIAGFAPDAGRFFFYELIIVLGSISLGQFFRTVSYATSNPDVARQMDFPFILLFVIFGGFLIVYNDIPDWLIWIYWINPMSYAVTSVAQNEFSDSIYDGVTTGGQRLGDSYLDTFGLSTNLAFKWSGVAFLFGFFLVFTTVSGTALYKLRAAPQLGTRRLAPLSESLAKKNEDKLRQKQHSGLEVQLGDIEDEEGGNGEGAAKSAIAHQQNASSMQIRAVELAMAGGGSSKDGSRTFNVNSLPFVPVTLAWRNIHYTVYIGKEQKPKKLLHGISGYVKPGQLVALMGSSGAGKTTLMDVVAGRKTVGTIEGDILVNGRPKDNLSFNRLSGYVEQQDLHMGLHTIYEALQFSARFRLPSSVDLEHRDAWVNEVMELVGLTRIQGRLIGDAATLGISPGQMKLLTIGVELVANPSVLFLDEPTSGLDAPSALRVMKAVRRIANTGRSVVCTIHQPSSELFFMFDRLLLLRSGGDEVYFDDIGPQGLQLVEYFERVSKGKAPKLPFGLNPANWMLDVISAGIQTAEGGGIHAEGFEYADYVQLWRESDELQRAKKNTEEACEPSAELDQRVGQLKTQHYIGWWERFGLLTLRYYTMHWRNAPTNLTRIMLCTIIGILLGLIYLDIEPSNFAGVQSMLSAIFMGMAFPASISAASAFPSLFRQRAVYYRESTIGMYDYVAYSSAIAMVEFPFIFMGLIFFMLPFYFMVGLATDGNLFFRLYLTLYLMAISYSFLSQLWMALASSAIAANVMNGFFMSMFFMFGGVFISASEMPIGWKWFYYIDPLPKALIAAALPQFYECVSNNDCSAISIPNQSGTQTSYDYISNLTEGSVSDYWQEIGWLILSAVVVRILNLIALKKISHLKR